MYPNVKYELQELEHLISSGWNKIDHENDEQDNTVQDTLVREVERIKQTFIHEVFNFVDERHLERYIQYHQQALVRLMDKVIQSENDPYLSIEKNISHHYYKGLEELLSYVERHFTKYFDQDAKAPESYIAIAKKSASINFKKLQKGLIKKSADGRIVELMLSVLRKIMDNSPNHNTTYRRVIYAKEIQKELFQIIENSESNQNINEELRLLIYYLNYNSIRCFAYHTYYINSILDGVETRAEKIEKLSYILKTINQAQVKPGIGYNLHAPSISSQLNSYILEETDHLERLQQLSNIPTSRSLETLFRSFKIQFEMSVAQIAYLVKIFTETRIIITTNTTGLLRFLSKFLVSKRTESFTYDSFRTKFYNVESSTKQSVKVILLKMVEHIDKN